MQSLEQALRNLAAAMTSADLSDIPDREMERVIGYMADNAATAAGTPGPQGQKGDPGPAGASVATIALMVDDDGKVTGGTATLSDSTTVPITVTTE